MCQPGEVVNGLTCRRSSPRQTWRGRTSFGVSVCQTEFSAIGSCCSRRFNTRRSSAHQRRHPSARTESSPVQGHFTYNMYPLEILQSSVNPSCSSYCRCSDRGLGRFEFLRPYCGYHLRGEQALRDSGGPRFALLGRNQAVVLVPDIVACDGVLHIVDSVLITPALRPYDSCLSAPSFHFSLKWPTSPETSCSRRSWIQSERSGRSSVA